ncbi:glycosyltransferase [Opitutaceae bacterium]|nr:glycosyltransferase [Opitutaceae bacterium]
MGLIAEHCRQREQSVVGKPVWNPGLNEVAGEANHMSLISVILPTCDRPDMLPRALASVLAQGDVDLEVVVVDCNRETGPVEANPAMGALLKDSRVRVVVAPHGSANASEARNTGLDEARGEWVSYLDDDDVYLPGKLTDQLALARDSESALVICGYQVVLRGRTRVRQCDVACYSGDDCLIGVDYPTSVIMHRADPAARFEPRALVGQDHLFVIDYLIRQGALRVPCVTTCGVELRTHAGPRLNVDNRSKSWWTFRHCLKKHRRHFSRDARRTYIAIGMLVRAQRSEVSWIEYLRCLQRVAATQGWRSWRLVLNALARRMGLRRWVVT